MLYMTSLELTYFYNRKFAPFTYFPQCSFVSPILWDYLKDRLTSCFSAAVLSLIFQPPSPAAPRLNKCHGDTEVACTMLGLPQRPFLSRILVSHVLAAQAALSQPLTLVLLYYIQLFWLFSVGVLVCYNLLHHSWKVK